MIHERNIMQGTPITFDQLPAAIYDLSVKIGRIEKLLASVVAITDQTKTDQWFTIEELSQYLPGKPAVSTLRDKTRQREIPAVKEGKRWLFRKSEIDLWLNSKKHKTSEEINKMADSYIASHIQKSLNIK